MTESELKRSVEEALHGEVRLRGLNINVAIEDGSVLLRGQVNELAEKRLAVNLVRQIRDIGNVRDQLRLASVQSLTDKQIAQHIEDGWMQDGAIHDRQVQVQVTDGVATLTGTFDNLEEKRLAGVIAWWVPGVVDVDNQIKVEPFQNENDGDLTDLIRLVFDKDILVDPSTIGVTARDHVVTLMGTVKSEEERQAAEHDCYYVWGVKDVINRLDVKAR